MSHRNAYRIALPRAPRGLSRHRRRVLAQNRKRHVKRATFRDCGRRCVYCGTSLGLERATLDHVFPLSRGGSHAPGNLVAACPACNQMKGSLLPAEFFARFRDLTATVAGSARRGQLVQAGRHVHLGRVVP